MRPLLSLLGAVTLAGCSYLVPSSLMQLRGMSPLTADPAAIAVRATLPEGLGVLPGESYLGVTLTNATNDFDLDEQFQIDVSAIEEGATLFRIIPEAVPDMRAVQEVARLMEERDPEGTEGSISVFLGLCVVGDGPSPEADLNIDLRTEVDGGFFPLVRGANIGDNLQMPDGTPLPPCT